MKTLIDHLAQYAAYHRDPRNIHTHFVGVPMIMFAVVVLLSRPVWWLGMVPVSPALACAVAAGIFYLRLDVRLGLVMSALLAAMLAGAAAMAPLGTTAWLAWGAGAVCRGLGDSVCGPLLRGPQARLCGRCDGFAGWAPFCGGRMGLCAGFARRSTARRGAAQRPSAQA